VAIRKKAVGSEFFRIYKINKIKYGKKIIKLIVNDNFYIFLKSETVRNGIIIRENDIDRAGIYHLFHP